VGEPFAISNPRDHADLGEALGLMDFEAAARMSGSRFVVLRGELARLERALGQFMLDMQTREHGYEEVSPPLLVRDEAMFGTGQLPKFEVNCFRRREYHAAGPAQRSVLTFSRTHTATAT
jgi:seryl-tRNA synthetase